MYPHGSGRSSIPGQTVFSLLLSLVGLLFFIIFFVIYRIEKTKERDERSLTSGTIVFHSFHTTRFSGCIRLSSVTCSEGLKNIQPLAFTACPALKDITLPSSLTSISNSAFPDDCTATFHVTKDSEGEKYCMREGFRYVYH
jgi:hypothetical protein